MTVLTMHQRKKRKLMCNKKNPPSDSEILIFHQAAVNHPWLHIALESVAYDKGGLNFATKSSQAFLHSYFSVSTFLIICWQGLGSH